MSDLERQSLNQWYEGTYDEILRMAPWRTFAAGVPEKLVCIYSWMPRTIMNVKGTATESRAAIYSPDDVRNGLKPVGRLVDRVRGYRLLAARIDELAPTIERIWTPLNGLLGATAASKYLHFSLPHLFPMCDVETRKIYHQHRRFNYATFMAAFREDLLTGQNRRRALALYPRNAIRGWDISLMMSRSG
jgi:hypothetical protein